LSKNIKTYLLLGLVLVIWGIIGYKLVSAFSPDSVIASVPGKVDFKRKTIAEKDTFHLFVDYRDPFLGTWNKEKKKIAKQVVRPKKIAFPPIAYTGSVSGKQTKDHIYFVSISGQQYLMKTGVEKDGVKLLSGTSKSITLRYKGQLKTISLTNEAP